MQATALIARHAGLLLLAVGNWGVGDAALGAGEQPAAGTVIQQDYRISCHAMDGKGFGVAKLLIEDIPPEDETWALDQTVHISSDGSRIWFPARAVAEGAQDESRHTAELYFIFHNGFPKTIDLYVSGQLVRQGISVVEGLDVGYERSVARWWSLFCQQSCDLAPKELAETNRDLLASVGQLLDRDPEYPFMREDNAGSQLEQEFERTLGMLLGFESVRLAMMTDESDAQVDDLPARLQLPRSLAVAELNLPQSSLRDTPQLPITNLVPQDCYFVRCQSLENYLWLRGLLVDWGGSLNELVSSSVVATDVRGRLERQLALSAETLWAAGVDSMLEDMAVIGSDVLFPQGAGVGVLFQARPGHAVKLANVIQSAREIAAVRPQQLKIVGVEVSLLATADNQVRSYYVRLGDFILLTNSLHIARSVIHARTAQTSLGNLAEFQYAMSTNPNSENAKILFYLSDPFFRRLASAAFRIELGRRRAAEIDCRRIEIAALIAEATGHQVTDKASLLKTSVLPNGFGRRSDGSFVEIRNGEAYDSLRGKPGTFVPVVDVEVKNCNASELTAYSMFSAKYRQEWRVMDPVLASLDAVPLNANQERLKLSVHITPYARQEYAFLTQFLGAPTRTYLSVGTDELMGVSASLQQHGQTYGAHLGLLDSDLEFEIKRGKVIVDGKSSQNIFVNDSSFAVVTPSDTQGLLTLNGLMKSLQNRRPIEVPAPTPTPVVQWGHSSRQLNPFSIFRSALYPEELLLRASITAIEGVAKASAMAGISQDERWAIYATDQQLHSRVRTNLVVRESAQPAEIHAVVKDVRTSAISPYLQAFTFCDARHESAKLAAWLNHWTVGLKTDPNGFRQTIEQASGGELVCPVGGQWLLQNENSRLTGTWTSSSWAESSLSKVSRVPEDYQFAFLDWFRGLELQFSLTNTSLESDIYVDYQPSSLRNQFRLRSKDDPQKDAQLATRDPVLAAPLSSGQGDFRHPAALPEHNRSSSLMDGQSTIPSVRSDSQRTAVRPAEIGIRINPSIMVVSLIKPGQPAARSSLQVGDRILEVNGIAVDTLESLRRSIAAAAASSGVVNLAIDRNGRKLSIEIILDSAVDVDL